MPDPELNFSFFIRISFFSKSFSLNGFGFGVVRRYIVIVLRFPVVRIIKPDFQNDPLFEAAHLRQPGQLSVFQQ